MKKIYLFFTFIISLFYITFENVNAEEFNIEIDTNSFDYLTEDFYKLREASINYCNENNKYYFIYIDNSNEYISTIFDDTDFNFEIRTGGGFRFYSSIRGYNYSLVNEILKLKGSSSITNVIFVNENGKYTYKQFLDTNYPRFITENSLYNKIILNYKNYSFSTENNDRFLSLYEIYKLTEGIEDDTHKEELSFLNNFYNLVIEKIGFLSSIFVNNYILLSIFVVFILIFVVELLRRLL